MASPPPTTLETHAPPGGGDAVERPHSILEREDFPRLIGALQKQGFEVIGPTVRDGAIVYERLDTAADLPEGWTDTQDAGQYRLSKRRDRALFGYAVGPHSWKQFLFPGKSRLLSLHRDGNGFTVETPVEPAPRYAFIGVRSCELRAIAIQDKVFLGSGAADRTYAERRAPLFIVALQCGVAGGTCFCVSMQAGPRAETGFDLALTEVLEETRHYFVVQTGSDRGAQIMAVLPHRAASPEEIQAVRRITDNTARTMGREMPKADIPALLKANYDHARWDAVAERCLTCANCTLACPTCFCSTVEDVTDLTGDHAERWRKWDSCFTLSFSSVAGGITRASTKSRYRQWLTHKLATWHDQFGSSGCVGCGRCITWCPVGIDITEEVRALAQTAPPPPTAPG